MTLVEKWVGLEYLEIPKYHFYTLSNYQEYNALDYLDNFEEDYEEGEWGREQFFHKICGV